MNVEKSDVNIAKLFYWNKKVELKDRNDNLLDTLYMRLVGDAEFNRARVFAIRESAKLRKELKNPDSDEYIIYIGSIEDFSKEELVEVVLSLSVSEYSKKALENTDLPIPKEPDSDAELEELEQYQEKIDNYKDELNEKYREYINKELTKNRERFLGKTKEELTNIYIDLMVNQQCETKMIERFREMCTYFSCYTDEDLKVPYFSSFEQFDNLPTEYKEFLVRQYELLDIGIDELKK